MEIESISGAAMVALASTLTYVAVATSWQFLTRALNPDPAFSRTMMHEAAQRFRDEMDRLARTQSVYLSGTLVFAVLFVAAYELDADRIFSGYPIWQLQILLTTLAFGATYAGWKLVQTVLACRRIRLLRDANIAVGHQLQHIVSGFGRVYHDVDTSAGIIDHVVVSPRGTYAIHVFAKRPESGGTVALDGNSLCFQPSGQSVSTVPIGARTAALEREFRRLVDHRVRVRSVIAVPGREVAAEYGEDHLLVNDRSLPALIGWNSESDHLLNEDVADLQAMLQDLCVRKAA